MTEKIIQKALFKKFHSHIYKFINVYFFENESDWLSFLQNGYCYEIEVKTSRGDFKADFKKNKHIIHESNGKNFYTQKGAEIWRLNPDWEFCKNFPKLVECKDYTDGYNYRQYRKQELYLSYCAMSSVFFREFKNNKLPNKFYYAVPKGLVLKDEIPEYAGLLYVDEYLNVEKIKEPNFIHKEILSPVKLFNKTYFSYEKEIFKKLNEK